MVISPCWSCCAHNFTAPNSRLHSADHTLPWPPHSYRHSKKKSQIQNNYIVACKYTGNAVDSVDRTDMSGMGPPNPCTPSLQIARSMFNSHSRYWHAPCSTSTSIAVLRCILVILIFLGDCGCACVAIAFPGNWQTGMGGTSEAMPLLLYSFTCTSNRQCWIKWCQCLFMKLIQHWSSIGATHHILWTRKIEEPDKLSLQRCWLTCLLSHVNRREYKVLLVRSQLPEASSGSRNMVQSSLTILVL